MKVVWWEGRTKEGMKAVWWEGRNDGSMVVRKEE